MSASHSSIRATARSRAVISLNVIVTNQSHFTRSEINSRRLLAASLEVAGCSPTFSRGIRWSVRAIFLILPPLRCELGKTLLSEHTCGYKDGCGTARGGRANCARSPRATSCSRTGKAKALSPRTNRAGRAKADLLPADCKRHISRARRRVPARKASPGAASVKFVPNS
jgi:hypothetical protein